MTSSPAIVIRSKQNETSPRLIRPLRTRWCSQNLVMPRDARCSGASTRGDESRARAEKHRRRKNMRSYRTQFRCDPYCPPPYPCPLVPPQFYGPDLIAKSYVAASCAFLAWVHGVPTGRPIQDIGSYPCPMSPTSSTVLYCTRHLTAARETAVKSDEAHTQHAGTSLLGLDTVVTVGE